MSTFKLLYETFKYNIHYRKERLMELLEAVRRLNRQNFRVKIHEPYVC